MIRTRFALAVAAALVLTASGTAPALAKVDPQDGKPSFNCAKARKGSIDEVICSDYELSNLDREMARRYVNAQKQTPRAAWPDLIGEQRKWIASRNQCMGGKGKRIACIAFAYENRILRLVEWEDGSALD